MNILQCLTDECELTFEEFSKVPDDADDSVCDYDYITSSDDDEPFCPEYCCVCCEVICGEAYKVMGQELCLQLHKSCADLPGEIEHPLHSHHPLKISVDFGRLNDWICDGCTQFSLTLKYRCEKCDFKLDFLCVFKHESRALKERVAKLTDYHAHELQLLYFSWFSPTYEKLKRKYFNFSCRGCQKKIRDSAYACARCFFFIHESCLDTAPKEVKNLSLHPHPLRFNKTSAGRRSLTTCQLCELKINRIGFKCQKCDYYFHLSCATRTAICYSFPSHQGYAHYIDHSHMQTSTCTVCDKSYKGSFFRSLETQENIHVECLLPATKNHESHDHPLILTDAVEPKRNHYVYHCDICEKPGNIRHHVYHCKECYYIAHMECVLSEEDSPLNDDSMQQQIDDKVQKICRVEEITKAEDDQESTEEPDYESLDELSESEFYRDIANTDESTIGTDTDTDAEEKYSKRKGIEKILEKKIRFAKFAIAHYTSRLTQLDKELAEVQSSQS